MRSSQNVAMQFMQVLKVNSLAVEYDRNLGVDEILVKHCCDPITFQLLNEFFNEKNHNNTSYSYINEWLPLGSNRTDASGAKEILLVLEDDKCVYIRNLSKVNFVPSFFSDAIPLDDRAIMWDIPINGKKNALPIISAVTQAVSGIPYFPLATRILFY